MELNKIRLLPWIAGLLICAALAIYSAGLGNWALFASSMTVGTVLLFLLPALYARNRKIQKVQDQTGLLLHFEYPSYQREDIAQEQFLAVRKTSFRVALLLCFCMAVVFAPLVWHSMQPQSGLSPMLPYMIAAMLLPFVAVPLAPAMVANSIRRSPCMTYVGRDYVVVANRYIGLNDRYKLNAQRATIHSGSGQRMRLRVQYSFLAGRTIRTYFRWVDIPVPYGKEREALHFVETFNTNADDAV